MHNDTTRFIRRGIVFLLIASSPFIVQLLFPIDHFNYRSWEALWFYRFGDDTPFYTNRHLEKIEEGDLAYRTPYAIKKQVIWQTDAYGFRNGLDVHAPYDIIIVGDSNIVGTGLSQEQMLASVLHQKTNLSVYTFASANVLSNVNKLMSHIRFREHPPSIVIVGSIERRIHELHPLDVVQTPVTSRIRHPVRQRMIEEADRAFKLSFVRQFSSLVRDRIKGRKVIANGQTGMVFYKLAFDAQSNNLQKLNRTIGTIVDYDVYLRQNGITFIFLPIPDKETIYASDIPEAYARFRNESPFLRDLIRALDAHNVTTIDTLPAFKAEKDEHPLYILDDTHWNEYAINLTADLIIEELNKNLLLRDHFQPGYDLSYRMTVARLLAGTE